jgi:hypothetical protein
MNCKEGAGDSPLRFQLHPFRRAASKCCIDELLEDLKRTFHRLRQNGIDEELFDVVSGFEVLTPKV